MFSHSYHQVPSSVLYYFHMEFSIKKRSTFFFFLFCLAFLGHEFVDLCRPQKKEEEEKKVSMHGVMHS